MISASRNIPSALRYITSASRCHPRYQSRFSMYIRGLIPRNFAELALAVPIVKISLECVTVYIKDVRHADKHYK